METDMTFREQSRKYMTEIASRKRGPVRATTLHVYRSILDARVLPALGGLELESVGNQAVKALVSRLAEAGLSPATISLTVTIVKQVMASAVNAEGDQLYPRVWNSDFIDAPQVGEQKAPMMSLDGVPEALAACQGDVRVLVALLASTGLRIGEALAIGQPGGNAVDLGAGTVSITSTMVRGRVQSQPKTAAGVRVVDLHPDIVRALAGLPDGKFSRSEDSYRRELQRLRIPGFHSLRRARITHLQSVNVPPTLIKFWVGHAATDITECYTKFGSKVEERRQWSERAGLGFAL